MSKKQTVFNLLFLVIVFGLTMYLVFRGKDIGDIIRTAREADGRYLLLSLVCVVIFLSSANRLSLFLYDENTWSQCENDSLCTVFLCWTFFSAVLLRLHQADSPCRSFT